MANPVDQLAQLLVEMGVPVLFLGDLFTGVPVPAGIDGMRRLLICLPVIRKARLFSLGCPVTQTSV